MAYLVLVKSMLRIIVLLAFLSAATAAHAETRGILVEVTPAPEVTPPAVVHYRPGRVNIYSDEKSEQKRDVSIAEAADVLRAARGWGSSAYLDIVFHHVIVPEDLIGILEGVKGNRDLDVGYIGRAESNDGKIAIERFKHLGSR